MGVFFFFTLHSLNLQLLAKLSHEKNWSFKAYCIHTLKTGGREAAGHTKAPLPLAWLTLASRSSPDIMMRVFSTLSLM